MISIGQQASGWKSIEIGRPRQGDRLRISGRSKDFINCNGRGRGFEDGEDLAGVSWDKGLMLGSKLSSCNPEVCTWYYISKYQIVFNFFQNHMLFVRLWMFWVWTKIKMSFSRQPDAHCWYQTCILHRYSPALSNTGAFANIPAKPSTISDLPGCLFVSRNPFSRSHDIYISCWSA